MNDQKQEEQMHKERMLAELPRLTREQVSLLITAIVRGEYEFAKNSKELS